MNNDAFLQQIDDAIAAHNAMKRSLSLAISLNDVSRSSHDISCDDKCAFGRWLKSTALPAEAKGGKPYQVISRLHSEFHKAAGAVARLNERGQHDAAMTLLDGDYAARSDTLNRALNKWRGEISA